MKYRIVRKVKGYNIQKKIFGLFWIDVGIDYYYSPQYHIEWKYDCTKYLTYKTYDDALEDINFIKNRYIKYKPFPTANQHTILMAKKHGHQTIYIDLNSSIHDDICGRMYQNVAYDLDHLKIDIQHIEEHKSKIKNGEKILKYYEV
jgi:hypothetical protein